MPRGRKKVNGGAGKGVQVKKEETEMEEETHLPLNQDIQMEEQEAVCAIGSKENGGVSLVKEEVIEGVYEATLGNQEDENVEEEKEAEKEREVGNVKEEGKVVDGKGEEAGVEGVKEEGRVEENTVVKRGRKKKQENGVLQGEEGKEDEEKKPEKGEKRVRFRVDNPAEKGGNEGGSRGEGGEFGAEDKGAQEGELLDKDKSFQGNDKGGEFANEAVPENGHSRKRRKCTEKKCSYVENDDGDDELGDSGQKKRKRSRKGSEKVNEKTVAVEENGDMRDADQRQSSRKGGKKGKKEEGEDNGEGDAGDHNLRRKSRKESVQEENKRNKHVININFISLLLSFFGLSMIFSSGLLVCLVLFSVSCF